MKTLETNDGGAVETGSENVAEEFTRLAPGHLGRSPWNRNRFNQGDLDELTADVKARGILQPLIVRRNPRYRVNVDCANFAVVTVSEGTVTHQDLTAERAEEICFELNKAEYEIIAGERRWRAATAAKLDLIPVIIRTADDRTAIEIQAVENLQRVGLNWVDEAEKYRQLIELYKADGLSATKAIDKIAAKLSKSRSLIYERLKIADLPESTRERGLTGQISPSLLSLIASIDDEAAREAVTKRILNPKPYEVAADDEDTEGLTVMAKTTTMSFRSAKRLVDETKAELAKKASYAKYKAAAEKKGKKVISYEDACETLRWGQVIGSKYVGKKSWCYDTTLDNPEKWGDFVAKHEPEVWLGYTWDGEEVELYKRNEAFAALTKCGYTLRAKAKKEGRDPEADARRQQLFDNHKVREERFLSFLGEANTAIKTNEGPGFWKFLFSGLSDYVQDEACTVFVRRGLCAPDCDDYIEAEEIQEKFKNLNGKELKGLIGELILARWRPSLHSVNWSEELEKNCKLLGLKLPEWEVQTPREESEAEKKPAAKKKAAQPKGAKAKAKGKKAEAAEQI